VDPTTVAETIKLYVAASTPPAGNCAVMWVSV
jgi:hypothetical protein